LQATGGAAAHGHLGALSLSKSLAYCAYALVLMAAFSHAHELAEQKLPRNTATQSESAWQAWS
jgi:hypothetical protein